MQDPEDFDTWFGGFRRSEWRQLHRPQTGIEKSPVEVDSLYQKLGVGLPEIGKMASAEGCLQYSDRALYMQALPLCQSTGSQIIQEN